VSPALRWLTTCCAYSQASNIYDCGFEHAFQRQQACSLHDSLNPSGKVFPQRLRCSALVVLDFIVLMQVRKDQAT
jgi:hypothetical protein